MGIADSLGYDLLSNLTVFVPLAGDNNWGDAGATEAIAQVKVYGNYTWSGASIHIRTNSNAAASTLRSRNNAGNGNQIVSIAAWGTGLFQDTTHSDSLVNGDLVDWSMTPGGVAGLKICFVACLMDGSPIQLSFHGKVLTNSYYTAIGGSGEMSATESNHQYTVRLSSTLSKMRVYISANDRDGTTTVRLRKNAGNGNEVISILAGTTGSFEDAVNTDAVVSGNIIDHSFALAGTTGSISKSVLQFSSSGNRLSVGATYPGNDLLGNQRQPVEGWVASNNTTEARAQFPALVALTIKNLFVRVYSNTRDGATTFVTRKNGGNGSLTVSIDAAATGAFEDTSNNDSLISTDLYNFGWTPGGSSGSLNIGIMGVEQQVPTAPPVSRAYGNIARKLVAAGVI